MPRVLVPSPNEEAIIRKEAEQRQKRERLIASRKQATLWCKQRTRSHVAENKQKSISQKMKVVKNKISDLENKENTLKEELHSALSDIGKGYNEADILNAQENDKRMKEALAKHRQQAWERHRSALKTLNEVKEQKEKEEKRTAQLKHNVLSQEKERSKRLLDNPLKTTQPLIEMPGVRPGRPMGGLDAFTKTYYHLPKEVGVVDEKSLVTGKPDARKTAEDVAAMMQECRKQLKASKQAREERAEVRGSAALEKVQLKNVLEDVTSQLDKYAIYSRTKKKPSTLHGNIFASNSAQANSQKQHQIDLEHAVEDIFDRHNERISMTLKSAVPINAQLDISNLDTIEEESETASIATSCQQNTEEQREVVEDDSDHLADVSRPSLSLYFPVQSDISSEKSPEMQDERKSTVKGDPPMIEEDLGASVVSEVGSTVEHQKDELSVVDPRIDTPIQPCSLSFTKPSSSFNSSSSSSTRKSSSTCEEILQELLSIGQESTTSSFVNSDVSQSRVISQSHDVSKLSDSISQHTLSQNSSASISKTPGSLHDASTNSETSARSLRNSSINSDAKSLGEVSLNSYKSSLSGISVGSSLSELQKQLLKINSHLNEIEEIKDSDAFYLIG